MSDPVPSEPGAAPGEPEAPVAPVEPEPRRYPSTIGGAFYIVILLAAAGAVLVAAYDDWRLGLRILAGCLAGAGLLRLVLPQRDAGMLAVRHRAVDVALLAAVAGALWWLQGSIPDQPM
ncbi:MAG: hypothetical protein CMH83_09105 [Nocardioides sp.]|nr:hypothetical protein [Nocardioides sp.]